MNRLEASRTSTLEASYSNTSVASHTHTPAVRPCHHAASCRRAARRTIAVLNRVERPDCFRRLPPGSVHRLPPGSHRRLRRDSVHRRRDAARMPEPRRSAWCPPRTRRTSLKISCQPPDWSDQHSALCSAMDTASLLPIPMRSLCWQIRRDAGHRRRLCVTVSDLLRLCRSPFASQSSTAIRANLHSSPKRWPGNPPSSARERTASAGSLRSAAASWSVSTSSVGTSGALPISIRPTETGPAPGISRSARSSLTRCCLWRPVAPARRSRAAAWALGSRTKSGVRTSDIAQDITRYRCLEAIAR